MLDWLVEEQLIRLPAQAESLVTGTLGDEGSLDQELTDQISAEDEKCEPAEQPPPVKTPFTLPRYDPLSSGSADGAQEAGLKVRLARPRIEAEEKAQARELQFRLDIKRLEIEADKAVRLRELELMAQREAAQRQSMTETVPPTPSSSPVSPSPTVDISKHIPLVPMFRETEVDSYFSAFERIASALKWPTEVWPLLLQCKIHGKAQDAVASLSMEESLSYEHVKNAILRAYELVQEAFFFF